MTKVGFHAAQLHSHHAFVAAYTPLIAQRSEPSTFFVRSSSTWPLCLLYNLSSAMPFEGEIPLVLHCRDPTNYVPSSQRGRFPSGPV